MKEMFNGITKRKEKLTIIALDTEQLQLLIEDISAFDNKLDRQCSKTGEIMV